MQKKPKTQKNPVPKRDRKTDIVTAAYESFSIGGLGVSIDEIAKQAGVAKQTIYAAFRDKLHLLAESTVYKYARITATLGSDSGIPPREMLHLLAENYYKAAMDEQYIRIMGHLLAEREKFAPVLQQIYNAGPDQNIKDLALYFERATLRGEMEVPAPFLAAETFFGALKGYIRERYWFKQIPPPTGAEIQIRINYLIDLFVKAYTK